MRVAAGQLSMFYMHLLIVNEGEGNGKGFTYERAYFSESLHKNDQHTNFQFGKLRIINGNS